MAIRHLFDVWSRSLSNQRGSMNVTTTNMDFTININEMIVLVTMVSTVWKRLKKLLLRGKGGKSVSNPNPCGTIGWGTCASPLGLRTSSPCSCR
jgi:hypothetical protein